MIGLARLDFLASSSCLGGAIAFLALPHGSAPVCLSVREDISEARTRSLLIFVHVAYGGGSVLLWQGDKIPKRRGSLGVLFPVDNALYSIAFGTHIKTAEPIEMPFGMLSGHGPRNSVLRGGDDHRMGTGSLWGKHVCPTSLPYPYELQIGLIHAAACTQ